MSKCSVNNDTMKIQKEIEYLNSHILENIVKNQFIMT